jgi:hypothetical protein
MRSNNLNHFMYSLSGGLGIPRRVVANVIFHGLKDARFRYYEDGSACAALEAKCNEAKAFDSQKC